MYQDNFQNHKKKDDKNKGLEIIILVLVLISIVLSVINIFKHKDEIFAQEETTQIEDFDDEDIPEYFETYEGDYTELLGYGCLTIKENHPYLYLENVESNKVLLKFDVFNKGQKLFTSKLIQPGDFDSLNVYELLDDGNYVLTYKVATYDINTQAQLMLLTQEQEIQIIKEE